MTTEPEKEPRQSEIERANALYVPCRECDGDGCLGPNPVEDGCRRCCGSGCEPVESLRQQAVEAAHWKLDGSLCRYDEDSGLFSPIDSEEGGNVPREEEDVVRDMVVAAEPFLRQLVVTEIAELIDALLEEVARSNPSDALYARANEVAKAVGYAG